jgi:hypothetical protein
MEFFWSIPSPVRHKTRLNVGVQTERRCSVGSMDEPSSPFVGRTRIFLVSSFQVSLVMEKFIRWFEKEIWSKEKKILKNFEYFRSNSQGRDTSTEIRLWACRLAYCNNSNDVDCFFLVSLTWQHFFGKGFSLPSTIIVQTSLLLWNLLNEFTFKRLHVGLLRPTTV